MVTGRPIKLLAEANTRKTVASGTCTSDREWLEGVVGCFTFPKLETQEETCWIWTTVWKTSKNTLIFVPNSTCKYQMGQSMFKQIFGIYVWVHFGQLLLKLQSKVNEILLSIPFIRVCDLHSCARTMIIAKAFDVFLHYPLFMFGLITVLRNPRLILKLKGGTPKTTSVAGWLCFRYIVLLLTQHEVGSSLFLPICTVSWMNQLKRKHH